MSLQLALTGVQSDLSAVARIQLTDPNGDVASVAFHVTGRDRRKKGPLAPDRVLSGNVFEKDVILDPTTLTRVDSEAILNDGTVARGNSALLASRFEPTNNAAAALQQLVVTPSALRIDVSATLGAAALWKCYARRGAWPTLNTVESGPVDPLFQRHEGSASQLSFSTFAKSGTWYVIAVSFNTAGQPGTRRKSFVQVTT